MRGVAGQVQGFSERLSIQFVTDVCCRRYLFETPAKKRFKTLPTILRMLDWWSPEYKAYTEATRKTAEKLGCSPKELRDDREWPKFKW